MKTRKDITQYNKKAWDREVELGNPWTVPVTPQEIAAAREGQFRLLLTPLKSVPAAWFPPMRGCRVLCLASGGGQQGPILAAAGAQVTVFDNSPKQLERDRMVAQREHLEIRLVEGDMADLSVFDDASFDFIVHPISNCFIPEVRPVWREAYRVLVPGGTLIAGFMNPVEYTFDLDLYDQGIYHVKYSLPFSDLTSISEEERLRRYPHEPVEFSHTLEEQIGGQLEAGFHLIGFYEDYRDDEHIKDFMPTFIATRALKPA
jgi:ubiquinone/menaquinone biosynthesis C-methylase UbiE